VTSALYVYYQPICRVCGLLGEHPTMERSITEAAIHRAAHYPDTPTVYGETDRHALRETEKKGENKS